MASPSSGSDGPNKRQRVDRSVEYDKEKTMRAIRSRPESKEAGVLAELMKSKNSVMLEEQKQFLKDFKEKGFGFVEGTKWSEFVSREQFTQEIVYITEPQILQEESGNEANCRAKIEFARSMGEGINEPGEQKGWYRDPSRDNAPVYYYARNVVHAIKLRKDQGRRSNQSTGNMAIKGSALSLPSAPGTVPRDGACPNFLRLPTSDTGTARSETNTSESAEGNGVLSLPSKPGTVPKDLGVSQQTLTEPLVCASSTEPGPVPKALNDPETGTGGQPDTKSACTPPTNTKDSETQEENTSREVNTSQEVNTAYEEKAMPLKPLEDNLINLLNEAKDHLCIYYAFKFSVTIYFIYIYMYYMLLI